MFGFTSTPKQRAVLGAMKRHLLDVQLLADLVGEAFDGAAFALVGRLHAHLRQRLTNLEFDAVSNGGTERHQTQ